MNGLAVDRSGPGRHSELVMMGRANPARTAETGEDADIQKQLATKPSSRPKTGCRVRRANGPAAHNRHLNTADRGPTMMLTNGVGELGHEM